MHSRLIRKLLVAPLALCIAAGGLLVAAPAAQAVPTSVTCTGGATSTYSPGITRAAQNGTATVSINLNCLQLLPLPLASLTGTSNGNVVNLQYSCESLLGAPPGGAQPFTFSWSTGDSSVFTHAVQVQRVNATTVVTLEGVISQGRYANSGGVLVITYLNPSLAQCDAPGGVTQLQGTVVFQIVAL